MPDLWILGKVIILQVLAAAVVVYILKRLLDKELVSMAIERAVGFQPSEQAQKAERVVVIAAGKLSAQQQAGLIFALKEKCPRIEVEFLENSALKGGLVVEVAGEVWDFSLMNRIRGLFQ